jgi:hypothetical protein
MIPSGEKTAPQATLDVPASTGLGICIFNLEFLYT